MQYLALTENDFSAVITLANTIHGAHYLSLSMLQKMHQQGIKQGINASFVAIAHNEIIGYRLSFAAGQWQSDQWCTETQWPVSLQHMAYFKSVGVLANYRGQGVAKSLLQHSIHALKRQGAVAGLAHIWRESPGNAAQAYFTKAGAKLIGVHADRWRHLSETLGYNCPCCGEICHCSAAEMVLLFTDF